MNRTYWENHLEKNQNTLIFFTRTNFCIKGTRKISSDSFTDENGYTWNNRKTIERIVTPSHYVYLIFRDDKRLTLCIPNFGDDLLFDVTDHDLSFLSSFDLVDKRLLPLNKYNSGIYTITELFVEKEFKSQVILSEGKITLLELEHDIRDYSDMYSTDEDFDDDYIDDNPHLGNRDYYIKVECPDGTIQYFEVTEESYEWNSHIYWGLIEDAEIVSKIEKTVVTKEHSFFGKIITREANRYTLFAAVNDSTKEIEFLATDKAPNGVIKTKDFVDSEIKDYRCSFDELNQIIKAG